MIDYQTGGLELVEDIKELWCELNIFHSDCSTHFGDFFPTVEFDKRKKSFYMEGKHLFVVIARENVTPVGYCVASFTDSRGEIESIYLKKSFRKHSIGKALMEKSLDWLKQNNIKDIDIYVAVGNETAYKFYEQFGFYPRVIKLTKK